MRLPALAAALVGLAAPLALAACDFTPTLDVPLPEFEPALTLNGVLAADSTVEVRVTVATDPYALGESFDRSFDVPADVEAVLLRDGALVGPLALRSTACTRRLRTGWEETYECGPLVSDVVIEAGQTYTVRASAPGYPNVEATVTVPARVPATATTGSAVERQLPNDGKRLDADLTVTFQDPPGPSRYGLQVIGEPYSYTYEVQTSCDEVTRTCKDSTVSVYVPDPSVGYTTTDPVLLTGARVVPSTGIHFIAFDDETFDGRERTLTLRSQQIWYPSYNGNEPEPPVAVWLVAADPTTFGAYQIAWFSGGEDNPFQEPIDLPSNVVGGYGLLGAVTINEARLQDAP